MKLIPTKIMVILESYRLELLESGMLEPKKFNSSAEYWRFYKPMTELTAFIVNLRVYNNKIKIVYGFSSTASVKMGGDEKILSFFPASLFCRRSVPDGVSHGADHTDDLGTDGVSGLQSYCGGFRQRTSGR